MKLGVDSQKTAHHRKAPRAHPGLVPGGRDPGDQGGAREGADVCGLEGGPRGEPTVEGRVMGCSCTRPLRPQKDAQGSGRQAPAGSWGSRGTCVTTENAGSMV